MSRQNSTLFDLLLEGDFESVVRTLFEQQQQQHHQHQQQSDHSSNNNNNNNNNDNQDDLPQDRELCLSLLLQISITDEQLRTMLHENTPSMTPHMASSLARLTAYQCLDLKPLFIFAEDELQQWKKLGHTDQMVSFIQSTRNVQHAFENGDCAMKLKLVLSDLIALLHHAEHQHELHIIKKTTQMGSVDLDTFASGQRSYESIVLDLPIYLTELSYILPLIAHLFGHLLDFNVILGSMLFLKQAAHLVYIMALNNPVDFKDIVDSVVLASIDLVGMDRIRMVLCKLCRLSPFAATYIRQKLVERTLLPDLVLHITSRYIHDEVDFICNIITNRQEYLWIKDHLAQKETPAFNEIRETLLSMLDSSTKSSSVEGAVDIDVNSIIRVYCGMGGVLGIKLNPNEVTLSIGLLEKNMSSTGKDNRSFPKLFLCFLLAVEGLLRIVPPRRVTECFDNLLKVTSCNDLMLLIAIYFHTRQLQNIVATVKTILGFRPSIHTESLNQIGELLTKDIFPEALVAMKSSLLPYVDNLSNNRDQQNTSIMCIYHLLSERIFEKYETDVGAWIWAQTLKASTPVHYLLPSCLDKLVKNIIEPTITTNNPLFYMKRIAEWTISSVFATSAKTSQVVQVLVVYYALRYNDSVMKLKETLKGKTPSLLVESTQLKEYSIEFLSKLPIQKCINIIQSNQADYFFIIPPFLYLISSQFPQFFNVSLLLGEEEKLSNSIDQFQFIPQFNRRAVLPNGKSDFKELVNICQRAAEQPTTTHLLLNYLGTLADGELIVYIFPLIQHLLPILIEQRANPPVEGLIAPFAELWSRVFPLEQSDIALKTINVLTTTSASPSILVVQSQYNHTDIISDPLLVFRAHPTVFNCPPLFNILLHILYFYMMSSKKYLQNQIQIAPVGSGKQEEITTLILTQESSIIQILLELCVVNRIGAKDVLNSHVDNEVDSLDANDSNTSNSNKLKRTQTHAYTSADIEEIRCNICNFIHQLFIEKPLLVKLIHFQGYMAQLLPITVTHIPSMHICFDFLPELLNLPSVDKQVFSIQLVAFLAEKYPIPKSLRICRQALGRIGFNLQQANNVNVNVNVNAQPPPPSQAMMMEDFDKVSFIRQTLPSMTRIAKTYPVLAEECLQILIDQLPDKQIYASQHQHQQQHDPQQQQQQQQLDITSIAQTSSMTRWLSVMDKSDIQTELHQAIQIIIKNLTKT
ncbi:hypothetical protein SAMD00019534_102540 [Acytostelium subglobosum LB1]|uniref:hypothetical protein n=1 Tax=Acytostelium subglobosum LB1 TaxID=1410327 RepID=UPI000644AA35|nr:hypothetical protein SAMD00019534_102540 [Acytostelium subglobosum LB1]GAM27079.1 hypothetical protein SAMD00019534_102540 [Acytostelium subglobosum LB1]|eukprot:XP_012749959.1 hypothetical protein SAMD00019534_102540 [Acytostelium subglobosum LB1]